MNEGSIQTPPRSRLSYASFLPSFIDSLFFTGRKRQHSIQVFYSEILFDYPVIFTSPFPRKYFKYLYNLFITFFWISDSRSGGTPIVNECDGEYTHDSRKSLLLWTLPLVDSTNKSGSLEFTFAVGLPGDFFPVNVSFASGRSYADLKVFLLYKNNKLFIKKFWCFLFT